MRVLALVCLMAAAATAAAAETGPGREERIERALARAAGFLAAAQSPDGAWRSDTYGTFRDGLALTPLALMSFHYLQGYVADGWARRGRAVEFLCAAAGPAAAGRARLEYPVYTAALSAIGLGLAPSNDAVAAARDTWRDVLLSHQFSAANGWRPGDAAYGGWGYTLEPPLRPAGDDAVVRHAANLSSTVFALAALRACGFTPEDEPVRAARAFVARCQRFDPAAPEDATGGFFFSLCPAANNKAGFEADGRRPRPYGSATADGFRALALAGVTPAEPRLQAALDWLTRHFDATRHAGVFEGQDAVWRDGYFYYQSWSVAHALHWARGHGMPGSVTAGSPDPIAVGRFTPWAEDLADELLGRQQPDGAWRNTFTSGREDDAVVATSFASAALMLCRRNLLMPPNLGGPVVHGAANICHGHRRAEG